MYEPELSERTKERFYYYCLASRLTAEELIVGLMNLDRYYSAAEMKDYLESEHYKNGGSIFQPH